MTDVVINAAGPGAIVVKKGNETKEKCSGFLDLRNIKLGFRRGGKFQIEEKKKIW